MKLTVTDKAKKELDDAVKFYENRSLGLGLDLLSEFSNVKQRLLEFPESAPLLPDGVRKAVLNNFPFNVIYDVDDERITILVFMHQARKPEYWKMRIRK